jgi:hypothetical protein
MVRAWILIVVLLLSAPVAVAQTESAIDTEAALASVELARTAASKDRHEEAARSYLDALNNDARLVGTVVDELAYQKLWRDDAEKAIFYFRRYLARHPGETNRDARKGLAMAYSWSGRQPQAIALYRELVAEDPDDLGSQLGLGRALVWDNRYAEGYRALRPLETDHRGTGASRGASQFLLLVLDEYDPNLDLRWDSSRDSDDLDIDRLAARGRTNLGNVLVEAGAGFGWYRQPGQPRVTAPRLQLGCIAPLSHRWTLHAYTWLDRFRSDGDLGPDGELDWTRLGGDAWLTFRATPRLRLDLGASSLPVETMPAFAKHLHHEMVSLSADYRLLRHWQLSAAGQRADFSDGNVRRRGYGHCMWKRGGTWELRAGPTFTYMDHDLAYPGGYWSPDWVRNLSLAAGLVRRWQRIALHLDGSLGQEKELGSDALTVGGFAGRLAWRVSARWLVAAGGGYSRSRFSSASGYSRTAVHINVRALF